MYLRRNNKTRMEVSIDEPLNVDWDGNELLLSDILGTEEDVIYQGLEQEAEHRVLGSAISKLSEREQVIVKLRFGINMPEGREKTQKESRGSSRDFPVVYLAAGKTDYEAAAERDCAV